MKKKKGLAIAARIMGILAVPWFSVLAAGILIAILIAIFGTPGAVVGEVGYLVFLPSGLILGILPLRRIRTKLREFDGNRFAIAGIVLSTLSLVSIPLVAAIAIPNLLASRRAANEVSAINTLRKLKSAELSYNTISNGKCGDLESLIGGRFLDKSMPPKLEKFGYKFVIASTPYGDCEINAIPSVTEGVARTGIRSFYMSIIDDWVIHAADKHGRAATIKDKPLNTD